MPSDKKPAKKAAKKIARKTAKKVIGKKTVSVKPSRDRLAAAIKQIEADFGSQYKTDPATGFILPGNCRPLLEYYTAVQTRFSGLRILTVGSYAHDRRDLHIDDLFVTPSLTETPVTLADAAEGDDCGKNLIRELKEHRRLVILGDPGAGKTTLVNWLAWSLTSTETHREINRLFANHVPIPLILRETRIPDFKEGDREPTLEKIFEVFTTQFFAKNLREHIPLLIDLFKRGQLFFLFDGIDELSPAKTDWLREAWLALYSDDTDQQWPGILTSRIVGYDANGFQWSVMANFSHADSKVRIRYPGFSPVRVSAKDFEQLSSGSINDGSVVAEKLAIRRYVAPFDTDRINSFSRSWYKLRINDDKEAERTARDFLAALSGNPSLRELRHSPLLLTFMALVYLVREKLPDGRALLYREITDAYISKLRSRTSGQATSEDVTKALFHLAWEAQKLRDKSKGHAEEEADSGILIPEKLVIRTFAKVFEGESKTFVRKLLEDCKLRTGLLIPRGKVGGEEHYAFAHLSFQEYFASQRILMELANEWAFWQYESEDFSRKNLVKLASETHWHETFVLLFESLSAQTGAMNPAAFAGYLFDARMEEENPFGTVSWSRQPEKLTLPEIVLKSPRGEDEDYTQMPEPQMNLMKLLVAVAADSRVSFRKELTDQIILRLFPLLPQLDPVNRLPRITSSIFSSQDLAAAFVRLLPKGFAKHKFKELNLHTCPISDLSPLANFTTLHALGLHETKVADISPLAKLFNLQKLYLSYTQIMDISPLATLYSLKYLYLFGTRINDLSPLSKLVSLQSLGLSNSQVADLSPLANLISLQSLTINETPVNDLSPLAKLPSLQNLELSGTNVVDLSPLTNLACLQSLRLESTQVTDLSPLFNLRKLTHLTIPKKIYKDRSTAALRKALPNLNIHGM